MNRRQFFKSMAGAAAGAAVLSVGGIVLLEQELWQPTKAIFLPPKAGWIAKPIEGQWQVLAANSRILTPVLEGKIYQDVMADFHRLLDRPKRYVITRVV